MSNEWKTVVTEILTAIGVDTTGPHWSYPDKCKAKLLHALAAEPAQGACEKCKAVMQWATSEHTGDPWPSLYRIIGVTEDGSPESATPTPDETGERKWKGTPDPNFTGGLCEQCGSTHSYDSLCPIGTKRTTDEDKERDDG